MCIGDTGVWLATTSWTPYRQGQVIGAAMVSAIVLVFAVRAVRASRRPNFNRKCELALATALVLWAFSAIASALFGPVHVTTPGGVAQLLVRTALGVTAFVLAVQGLIERRAVTPPLRGGRAAAVAIAIAVLGLGVPALVLITGGGRQSGPPRIDTAPETRLEFDDLNFEFTAPPGPWSRVDAKVLNPTATLAFLRAEPETYFMIIAEKLDRTDYDSPALLSFAKARLSSVSQGFRIILEEPEVLGGLEGIRLRSETTVKDNRIRFDHWVGARNGYGFQLVTWSRAAVPDLTTFAAARDMCARFRLIDPDRRSPLAPAPLPPVYRSEQHGYSVNLRGGSWLPWKDLATSFEAADFGTTHSDDTAALVVFPVRLFGLDPDLEVLASGLLSLVNVEYPSHAISTVSPMERNGVAGLEIAAEMTVNGTEYSYVFHVIDSADAAYLVAAWHKAGDPNGTEVVSNVLSGFTIEPGDAAPPSIDALSKEERRRHAIALDAIGRTARRSGRADAAAYHSIAVDLDPTERKWMISLLEALLASGAYANVVERVEAHAAAYAADLDLLSYRPYALTRLGEHDRAIEEYTRLFDAGLRLDEDLSAFTDALFATGRADEALARTRAYLEAGESPKARLLLASLHRRANDLPSAISALEEALARSPDDPATVSDLIGAYRDAGRHGESLDVARAAIARRGPTASLLYERGRSEYHLGWYKDAKETFAAALEKEPANPDIAEFHDHVTTLVGEGSNRLVRTPIDAVPMPPGMIDGTPEPAPSDRRDAFVARRTTCLSFREGVELRSTDYRTVKILTNEGASGFSSFGFRFDPLTEAIYVNSLVVTRPDGETVYTGQLEDTYVVDVEGSTAASQEKKLVVPVKGLSPGCTIELAVTRRDFAAPRRLRYFEFPFYTATPTGRIGVSVTGDVAPVASIATGGIVAASRDGVLAFTLDRSPVHADESAQPPLSTFLPVLVLGDERAAWSEVASSYLETIADRLVPDVEAGATAKTVLEGIEADAEKALALARFVRDSITYKAIAFGPRAYVPQKAADVLRARYGDCKDHSVLLAQLLRAAGIRADLALVHTWEPLRETLPSLDQFNHMVVHCPTIDGGRFFDTTDRSMSLRERTPLALGGKKALVLDPARPRIETIPEYAPNSSALDIERTIDVTEDGGVEVTEEIILSGHAACYFRLFLLGYAPDERAAAVQRTLSGSGGNARIRGFEVKNLETPDAPLVLLVRNHVDRRFHADGERLVGKIPAPWERYYLEPAPCITRTTPFEIAYPLGVSSKVLIRPPAGYELAEPVGEPKPRGTGAPFFSFETTITRTPESARVTFVARKLTGVFPPADYERFETAAAETLAAVETEIVMVRSAR